MLHVQGFIAINYCQKELQHSCHKNPGSGIDYNSINNEMFSGIFSGCITVGIQHITAYINIHIYIYIYIYIYVSVCV